MSAYGKTELDPEILLSWAMQIFYENPVLSRQTVQTLLTALATPGAQISQSYQKFEAQRVTFPHGRLKWAKLARPRKMVLTLCSIESKQVGFRHSRRASAHLQHHRLRTCVGLK